MELNQQTLLHPPFESDPPVKFNIDAKILGLVYAILAGIGALIGLVAIPAAFGLGAIASALGMQQIVILIGLGAVVSEIGTILIAWGGWKMYQLQPEGKNMVIYGLGIHIVAGLITALGSLNPFSLVGWIVGSLITFVFYYLVIISRFPGEAQLAPGGWSMNIPSGGQPGAYPPPGAQPPTYQPPTYQPPTAQPPVYQPPAPPTYQPPPTPQAPPPPGPPPAPPAD
jgi:hypothetical protein